ncbi:Trk system potassium uptake protein TrkA, amine-terminal domain protein (macronuclear) [Tetrahymena thermophila SB210]|uniref:Trk system potassium uptake protein TrkA, amine-terminal domain protein n=1 Tax=Tetrahymena thermophila (strain SB210) TaxID=312017 RepID=Q23Q95_TETTS|nr:Trk system potassium uptake protein TrkA, amine-terminal domain protein [Tetrahymena thermophila SB210]EAR98689.1 Trk system potassium uptake protein TrkA, amine-terminal domain protein [Tetrahymena thermophila SB210]|eukprot:XP_001018934.1 Trk system potassium uptake protein TrkA, amine-terminal domain protein [Tetrahymena thermophila SB210]
MNNQKILVLGATGQIGAATVRALAQLKANVTAGVRNPSKAKELEDAGVTVVKADMGQPQSELAQILKNYDNLYVVTPGHVDRSKLAINAIKAAQEAHIKYILVVSMTAADNLEILFGKQFNPIEKELKQSGLNYGILRFPMFTDNIFGNAEHIKSHNSFYGPIEGDRKFVTVAIQDAALAAATILVNPSNHMGKTYCITSELSSSDEQAKAYTEALARPIKYVKGTYEGTKKALLNFMPEWQVDGVLELYRLIEKKEQSQITYSNDFKTITGKEPTTHLRFMQQFTSAF